MTFGLFSQNSGVTFACLRKHLTESELSLSLGYGFGYDVVS